jgi:hypothetical protein
MKLVSLYECETSSLSVRQEYRLRMMENRMLREIFGPRKVKVAKTMEKIA